MTEKKRRPAGADWWIAMAGLFLGFLLIVAGMFNGGCAHRTVIHGDPSPGLYVPEGAGRHTWFGALEVDGKIVSGMGERAER